MKRPKLTGTSLKLIAFLDRKRAGSRFREMSQRRTQASMRLQLQIRLLNRPQQAGQKSRPRLLQVKPQQMASVRLHALVVDRAKDRDRLVDVAGVVGEEVVHVAVVAFPVARDKRLVPMHRPQLLE